MSAERQRIDTQAVEDAADLFALASQYTTLDKNGAGPCPKCGGDDRFHLVKRGGRFALWSCRTCRGDKHEGAIGLVMWAESAPFLQAVRRITGDAPPPRTLPAPVRPQSPPPPAQTPEMVDELGRVADANAARMNRPEGEPVRDFMASRGILPETWRAFGLGSALRPTPGTEGKGPKIEAAAIPYVGPGGVVGIRYRALAPLAPKKEGGKPRRYFSHAGSLINGAAFGLLRIDPAERAAAGLVIVEGEINALSVYQSVRTSSARATQEVIPDVISPGSESADVSPFVRLAALYARVLVWADTPAKVERMISQLGHPNAAGVSSEEIEGQDANDVLRGDPARLAALIASRMPADLLSPRATGETPNAAPVPPSRAGVPVGRSEERNDRDDAAGTGPETSRPAQPACALARVHARGSAGGEAEPENAGTGGMALRPRIAPDGRIEATEEEWLEERDEAPPHDDTPAEVPRRIEAQASAESTGADGDKARAYAEVQSLMTEYAEATSRGEGGEWRRREGARMRHLADVIDGTAEYESILTGRDLAAAIGDAFRDVPVRATRIRRSDDVRRADEYRALCDEIDRETSPRVQPEQGRLEIGGASRDFTR